MSWSRDDAAVESGDRRGEVELPAVMHVGLGFGRAVVSPPPYLHLLPSPFASSTSDRDGLGADWIGKKWRFRIWVRWERDFGGSEGHYWADPSWRGVAHTARSVAGPQIEIAKIDSLFSENFPRPLGHSGPQATTICLSRPIHPVTSLISSPPLIRKFRPRTWMRMPPTILPRRPGERWASRRPSEPPKSRALFPQSAASLPPPPRPRRPGIRRRGPRRVLRRRRRRGACTL